MVSVAHSISDSDAAVFRADFDRLVASVVRVVLGKANQVELAVVCLLAGGHLLIEDVPGMAKTRLAKALAHSIQGRCRRIQFTADLLPSDVVGVNIFDQRTFQAEFRPGPIFTNILLGDEINRAPPKTQAALLEAMAECQVTVDGRTRKLDRPFLCICTQNPVEFQGTYGLPEAQLDRFTMRLALGYPDRSIETQIIRDNIQGKDPEDLDPVLDLERVRSMGALARSVWICDELLGYIAEIAAATRGDVGRRHGVELGVSPRGSLALALCAMVWAIGHGRRFATDEDVQAVARPVLAHRLVLADELDAPDGSGQLRQQAAEQVIDTLLRRIPVPRLPHLAREG